MEKILDWLMEPKRMLIVGIIDLAISVFAFLNGEMLYASIAFIVFLVAMFVAYMSSKMKFLPPLKLNRLEAGPPRGGSVDSADY